MSIAVIYKATSFIDMTAAKMNIRPAFINKTTASLDIRPAFIYKTTASLDIRPAFIYKTAASLDIRLTVLNLDYSNYIMTITKRKESIHILYETKTTLT